MIRTPRSRNNSPLTRRYFRASASAVCVLNTVLAAAFAGGLHKNPPVRSGGTESSVMIVSDTSGQSGGAAQATQQAPSTPTPGQAEPVELEPGKSFDRRLASSETHTYQLTLSAGQYASVIVEQRGVDVLLRLIGPNGKTAGEFDGQIGAAGQERLEAVADVDGRYRIVVEGKGPKGAASGAYELKLAELRPATETDRSLREARRLYSESSALRRAGKYDDSLVAGRRGLELVEKLRGPEHPDVAAALNGIAEAYRFKGDYKQAEPLFQRALEIRQKVFGPEHIFVSYSLNNLALLYYDQGDTDRAEPLFQRALQIKEKLLGPDHLDLANSINNLGMIYSDRAEFAKAEQFHQRALDIREKSLGPFNIEVAYSLNNLAAVYSRKGDYTKAMLLHERALAIREKLLPPGHPSIASSLNNLAVVHFNRGDYDKSEELQLRSLAMREKALGPDHISVAFSLNNLAEVYRIKGDLEKAQPLYERALRIKEKALGPNHPDIGSSVHNLGTVYFAKREYERAEELYLRAKQIYETAWGADHPYVTYALESLAMIAIEKGDTTKARELYEHSLAILDKAFGPDNPRVGNALGQLASIYTAQGDIARATAAEMRANVIVEKNIALNLATGSEREKLAYLASVAELTDRTVSLHVREAPERPEALRLAITTILQRKGRVLDAMSDSLASVRRSLAPQDRSLLDALNDTTSRLASLVLNGSQRPNRAEYDSQIKQLEQEREKLESEVSRRSVGFYQAGQTITLADIQAAVPADAAAIEFAIYRPFNSKAPTRAAYGPPRYVAYVIRHDGDVRWKELGDAKAIDGAIQDLRAALRDPKRTDVRSLARTVEQLVIEPLGSALNGVSRLLVSPDGALNLIPFEALVNNQNQYLLQAYSINYLSSGRDLLRLRLPRSPKSAPLVLTNPLFGEPEVAQTRGVQRPATRPAAGTAQPESGRAGDDLPNIYFAPLDGTAEEGRVIKSSFTDARILTGAEATESALKSAQAPRILHIATHGFFLRDSAKPASNPIEGESSSIRVENPLLRSGLALAGANLRTGERNDGVLTALEASGLSLWGTKLVTLSACDTGIGEVKNGEGVYGLRRAFMSAGTETLVMSLWPVSDYVTRELMSGYYQGLRQGLGRGEALRQVQLGMLKRQNRQHPFYWASFIQSGEWASLEGKR